MGWYILALVYLVSVVVVFRMLLKMEKESGGNLGAIDKNEAPFLYDLTFFLTAFLWPAAIFMKGE